MFVNEISLDVIVVVHRTYSCECNLLPIQFFVDTSVLEIRISAICDYFYQPIKLVYTENAVNITYNTYASELSDKFRLVGLPILHIFVCILY